MRRYVRYFLPNLFVVAVAIGAVVAGLLASGSDAVTLQTATPAEVTETAAEPPADDVVPARAISTPRSATERLGAPPPAAPEYTFIWPVSGAISQGMTAKHPRGLDIAAELGEPVIAARAGEVILAGGDACCEYGLHVVLRHDDGWSSLYAHMDSLLVGPGDRVEQGDTLGLAGTTGKSNGVHLHLELLSLGVLVNPLGQLQPLRSYTPPIEPIETPEGVDEPDPAIEELAIDEPGPAGSSAGEAIEVAIRWMAQQGEAGYQVDRDSCFAIASGPNWAVSCAVEPWDCEEAACGSLLEACVIGSARLVEATCSGY